MQHYELVQLLAANPGKLAKQAIITEALLSGHREFFIGAKLALDVLVKFGVSKIPQIAPEDLNPENPGTFSFDDFLVLAAKLENRELTGNAARDAIKAAAAICHGPSWNDFYRRVLLKDLRCGVNTTINKTIKSLVKKHPEITDLYMTKFECQLAENGAEKSHAKKIKGIKLADIKLDGVRLLTILDKEDNTVIQYTRDGKINDNFTNISQGLAKLLPDIPFSIVLDGEVIARTFQEMMTQINRQKDVDTSTAKLALFDIIPLADFRKKRCEISQRKRHAMLVDMEMTGVLKEVTNGSVYVIPKIEINLDTQEGRNTLNEFNSRTLEAGFEGVMLKNPEAPYVCTRNDGWIKVKPHISVSLEIVGYTPGDPDGKRRDVLGAFILRGEDDGRQIQTKCGGGISDEQLVDFWNRRDELIGMIAEIEADCFSLEAGSDVYSLRFPRFKGFRGTKPGEKL